MLEFLECADRPANRRRPAEAIARRYAALPATSEPSATGFASSRGHFKRTT
jgi:hypothetical protein